MGVRGVGAVDGHSHRLVVHRPKEGGALWRSDPQIRVSHRRPTPEKRVHSEIGDIPPAEHETLWYRQQDLALKAGTP